jgi:hypothetical protein
MAKNKTTEPQPKDKVFTSAEEISQSIVKLRARIHQVEELKKDGLPYRDALRVTAEYQLRDTILEIFGERSPEYLQHQNLRIKVNSKHSINETISLLQHLVVSLEERRLDLLGLRSQPSGKGPEKGPEKNHAAPAKQQPAPQDKGVEPPPIVAPPPPVLIPSPPVQPVQVQPTPSAEPARVALTVEVKQPAIEPSALPATPPVQPSPIMLVSQTKLKLSAEAVAHAPEAPPVQAPEPLRFQNIAAPLNVNAAHIHPSSESSMTTKFCFPSSDVPTQFSEPPRAVAPPDPLRNGNGSAGQYPSSIGTPIGEGEETDAIAHLRRICSAFHRVARQLRQRRDERPTLEVEDERDMLDLLQALLSIEYDSIEPDEWAPTYANSSTRTDLWLKEHGVVIIAKKTRQGIGAKALTHQVSVDFERYGSHPDCRLMFCFIYDPEGRIGNPKSLEADLTLNYNGRRVEALISPK